MSCSWVFLASLTTPQRFCDKPCHIGHSYCPEHQCEMDTMHQAVCEEPKEEQTEIIRAANRRS